MDSFARVSLRTIAIALVCVALAGCSGGFGFGTRKTETAAAVYCWGNNYPGQGQLGIGNNNDQLTPHKVVGGHTFVDIAAGGAVLIDEDRNLPNPANALEGVYKNVLGHTCGVTDSGEAYCWGNNYPGQGQLGIGTNNDQLTPQKVQGSQKWGDVAAGGFHTCAVTKNEGDAYCWGNNYPGQGQLGIGTNNDQLTPHKVKGDHRFLDLAAGRSHTCGVDLAGDEGLGVVYCWGNNHPGQGQLGDGTNNDKLTPQRVMANQTFQSVVAGGHHTCALTTTGEAYCWGNNYPGQGQLGIGNNNDQLTPQKVKGGHEFKDLAAGGMIMAKDDSPNTQGHVLMVGHTCGVTEDGDLYCWGNNYPGQGQLGIGTNNDQLTPHRVQSSVTFESVVAGGAHTCAVAENGTAYCWGNNYPGQGQLGIGTNNDQLTPHRVQSNLNFAGLTAGGHHTCGIARPSP